jgi:short-subunit dehydrogenase
MISQPLKVFVIGASGSLGRALAEEEAARGSSLVLIASDLRDLGPIQSDLILRFNVVVDVVAIDFRETQASERVQVDGDRYYFPIGATYESDHLGGSSGKTIESAFQTNLFGVAGVISHILSKPRKKRVDLIGFGSIAETRGRSNQVFYSAAKRALTCLFESLYHGSEKQNIRPYLVQVGYMKSQLSFGKKMLFPPADPKDIAKSVLNFLDKRNAGIIYLPWYWSWICRILKWVPWAFYKKLNF